MNVIETVFLFRGIERVLIQLGAITCVVLGTLLFRWGVTGSTDATATGAGFNFALKNAAPGSVLALFGMVIMVVGIEGQVSIAQPAVDTALVAAATSRAAGPPAPTTSKSDGGISSDEHVAVAESSSGSTPAPPPPTNSGVVITYAATTSRAKNLMGELQRLDAAKTGAPKTKLTQLSQEAGEMREDPASPPVSALLREMAQKRSDVTDEQAAALLADWAARARKISSER